MRSVFQVATAVAALSASTAFAGLQSNGQGPSVHLVHGVNASITAQPLDSLDASPRHGGNNMYAAMAGPFASAAAATGFLGFDDYQGATPPGDADGFSPLDEFGFVGGVTAAGMTLVFEFYDAAQNFHDSFSVTFASAGNFIYTINGTPADSPPIFDIPNNGYVQIVAPAGSSGQWFLSTTLPTVGTESNLEGGNAGPGGLPPATHSHRFRLDVPEPATLALLSFGALAMLRRRR